MVSEDISIQEQSDIRELLNGMLGKDWETKTELSKDEIVAINSLITIIDYAKKEYKLDISMFANSIYEYMKLKISLKRKSRSETVKVLAKTFERLEEKEDNENKIEDLIG